MPEYMKTFVPLTEKELLERSDELANKFHELDGVLEAKKDANREFAAQENELEREIRDLGRTIRQKKEERTIEVVLNKDLASRIVRVLRADTMEELPDKTRPMTVEEVHAAEQPTLPFGEGGQPAGELAQLPDDGAGPPPAEDPETGEPIGETVPPEGDEPAAPSRRKSRKSRKAKGDSK